MKDPIFNVSEIMWHILGFAEFRSIVVIGHTNQKGRLYMQFALAALISTMVKAYLPTACRLLTVSDVAHIFTRPSSFY